MKTYGGVSNCDGAAKGFGGGDSKSNLGCHNFGDDDSLMTISLTGGFTGVSLFLDKECSPAGGSFTQKDITCMVLTLPGRRYQSYRPVV